MKPSTVDTANALPTNPLAGRHALCIGYPKGSAFTRYDTCKGERIFGIKFRTMSETTTDMLKDFARESRPVLQLILLF